jgi:probable F420-dependent oxidoreductase
MKLSVSLFGVEVEETAAIAVHADQAGIDTLWLSDHLTTPLTRESRYPYSASGKANYQTDTTLNDIWVLMGYLSASTQRIQFGSGVYIAPLRNPFVTALAVATAQKVSGGRVRLGLGAGWLAEEYDAVGEDFATRIPRLEEIVTILRGLWSGDDFAFAGEYYQFSTVRLGGRPPQRVPLIMSGTAPKALERAARLGDGWYGPVSALETSIEAINQIKHHRHALQREESPFDYVVRLDGDATSDNLRRYRDAGVDHVVISAGHLGGRTASVDLMRERMSAAVELVNHLA